MNHRRMCNRAINQIYATIAMFVSIYWPSEIDASLKIDDDLSWQFTAYARIFTLNSLLTAAKSREREKNTFNRNSSCNRIPSFKFSLFLHLSDIVSRWKQTIVWFHLGFSMKSIPIRVVSVLFIYEELNIHQFFNLYCVWIYLALICFLKLLPSYQSSFCCLHAN